MAIHDDDERLVVKKPVGDRPALKSDRRMLCSFEASKTCRDRSSTAGAPLFIINASPACTCRRFVTYLFRLVCGNARFIKGRNVRSTCYETTATDCFQVIGTPHGSQFACSIFCIQGLAEAANLFDI